MATPEQPKSAKFSPAVHARLMTLARELNGTVDDALRHLLGMSTIRVPVSEIQRVRWTEEATAIGVTVEDYVRLRIENHLDSVGDHATINQIYYRVDALVRAAGLTPGGTS